MLTEMSAPWPTSATILRSPKYAFSDFVRKAEGLVREYFLSGDYPAFADQLYQLRTTTWNDWLVGRSFEFRVL